MYHAIYPGEQRHRGRSALLHLRHHGRGIQDPLRQNGRLQSKRNDRGRVPRRNALLPNRPILDLRDNYDAQ